MAPPPTVGFSDLPAEALDEIARRAGPLDNVLCSTVCRSWRRTLKTTRLGRLEEPCRPHSVDIDRPMFGPGAAIEISPITYDGTERSVRTAVDRKPGADTDIRIIGCLLLRLDRRHIPPLPPRSPGVIVLLDPFTGRRFPLPAFTDNIGFRKAALTPGRRLGTYAMMAIHGDKRGMSYIGPGTRSWKRLRIPRGMPHKYVDAIFHKGTFCMLSCFGEVNAWAPDGGGSLRTRRLADPQPEELVWAVLVEAASREDLLMVSTTHKPQYLGFCGRKHYDERDRKWLPVKDLGETAILAGSKSSFCVSARGSSSSSGIPRSNYR